MLEYNKITFIVCLLLWFFIKFYFIALLKIVRSLSKKIEKKIEKRKHRQPIEFVYITCYKINVPNPHCHESEQGWGPSQQSGLVSKTAVFLLRLDRIGLVDPVSDCRKMVSDGGLTVLSIRSHLKNQFLHGLSPASGLELPLDELVEKLSKIENIQKMNNICA